jgi:hypothetical protein
MPLTLRDGSASTSQMAIQRRGIAPDLTRIAFNAGGWPRARLAAKAVRVRSPAGPAGHPLQVTEVYLKTDGSGYGNLTVEMAVGSQLSATVSEGDL